MCVIAICFVGRGCAKICSSLNGGRGVVGRALDYRASLDSVFSSARIGIQQVVLFI